MRIVLSRIVIAAMVVGFLALSLFALRRTSSLDEQLVGPFGSTIFVLDSGPLELSPSIVRAGSHEATLLIIRPQRLDRDLHIPANVLIIVLPGALIDLAGHTIYITGPFEAGLYRVFTGRGTVHFGDPASNSAPAHIQTTVPQWWGALGDGNHDDTESLQAAIDAIASPMKWPYIANRGNGMSGGVCYLPPGRYLTGTLNMRNSGTTLHGASKGSVTLVARSNSRYLLAAECNREAQVAVVELTIEDLTFDYTNLDRSDLAAALHLTNAWNIRLSNLSFITRDETTPAYSVALSDGVYLTDLNHIQGYRFQFRSKVIGNATTISCRDISGAFVDIHGVTDITFIGLTVQGNSSSYGPPMVRITDSRTVSFIGGDFEGDVDRVCFDYEEVDGLLALNNNFDGFAGTYVRATGTNQHVQLRDHDTYLEGSTAPKLLAETSAGETALAAEVSGHWVRTGNVVKVWIDGQWHGHDGAAVLAVDGLPFPCVARNFGSVTGSAELERGTISLSGRVVPGTSHVNIFTVSSSSLVPAPVTSHGQITLACEYVTADNLVRTWSNLGGSEQYYAFLTEAAPNASTILLARASGNSHSVARTNSFRVHKGRTYTICVNVRIAHGAPPTLQIYHGDGTEAPPLYLTEGANYMSFKETIGGSDAYLRIVSGPGQEWTGTTMIYEETNL
jgi:hypothetical protein